MSGDNRLPVLAAQIKVAHAGVEDAAKTAAERAIEAGTALLEAKALVEHGQWLPWLKEHCDLPERTAQFYMKIVKLGLNSATVADLGLKAAAKSIVLQYPDPFADDSEEQINEWLLFVLFLMTRCNFVADSTEHEYLRLKRTGWDSPSEYFGPDGDRLRKAWGMRELPQKTKDTWSAFLVEHKNWRASEISDELKRIAAEQDAALAAAPKRKRKRRRKS